MFKLRKLYFPVAAAIVAGLGIVMAGCAARAIETERLLAAAGFQMKLADTPEKVAHLETLTQRQLVPHQRDGKIYYVYADANYCKCVYVGTEEAYQQYQKLAFQKKIAAQQLQAAEMNQDAAMNWNTWGPWGPGPWY